MTCNKILQEQGLPYPRTCRECRLGPCNYSKNTYGKEMIKQGGMSDRTWFAGMALMGICANPTWDANCWDSRAKSAYKAADAMLHAASPVDTSPFDPNCGDTPRNKK